MLTINYLKLYTLRTRAHMFLIKIYYYPTNFFFLYDSKGKEIYADHFSENGHIAFAECFIDWYRKSSM